MKSFSIARVVAMVCGVTLLASCGSESSSTPGGVTFATTAQATSITSTSVPAGPTTTAVSATILPSATTLPTATTVAEPLGDPAAQLVQVATADSPVDLAVRPGDDRSYLALQNGIVAVVDAGQVQTALDLTNLTSADRERGLLGLAFHPTQNLLYVNYTNNSGNTVVAEYAIDDAGVGDPASARVLLTIEQPYANHNGGNLAFGPDGMLYIGMGDGGSANDPERRSLNVSQWLGKILRIDVQPSADLPYTVPADNPFVGIGDAHGEIWSVGVRNPWRFSFDKPTGDLWIADVGQGDWEEVNVAPADATGMNAGRGMSFGWSAFEGTHRFNDDQSDVGHTPPIFEYQHGDAGCSISGGAVYRGTAIPALAGWYVYSDYCSGSIRALQLSDRTVVRELTLATTSAVAAVRTGPNNELFVVSANGSVFELAAV